MTRKKRTMPRRMETRLQRFTPTALPAVAAALLLGVGAPAAAQQADLVVTKTDDLAPVEVNETLTYTITVENNGPSDAENVIATDTLPDGVTFVESSGCAEDPDGARTCSLGTIPAADEATYTLAVVVDPDALGEPCTDPAEGTCLVNTVSVSSTTPEAETGDETATEETELDLVADLELTVTGLPDVVFAGGPLSYTLTLTNHGPAYGRGTSVRVTLPLSFNHGSNDCGVSYSPPGPFEWTINDFPAGSTLTCTIDGTVDPGTSGEITSPGSVSQIAFMNDPDLDNNSDEATTTVIPADTDVDFGDAPDPFDGSSGDYPTLLASSGAVHALSANLFLGGCADADADGQPTASADGDDSDTGSPVLGTCATAGDDEDGVAFTSNLIQGGPATVEVTASEAGLLDAWIDWNADGDWDDAGEQVFTSESLGAGVNALGVTVPAGAATGTTFARFRLSSGGGLDPTGFAADGEVEDHAVTVRPPSVLEIPTLGEWGLALLGLLLAGLGAARLRG